MFTQMQVLERLLMIYIQMSSPLLFLMTNCRTWRDWFGCLEQHKLSDAPIKRDRPLHCNEKSPHWRCNTIRTARHPFEWTSSHSWLQLISESSWWNRIILWNTNQQRKYIFQTSPNHQVGSPQRDSPNKTNSFFLRLRDLYGHHGFLYHFPGGLPSKCLTFLCGISASCFFGGSYDLKT